MVTYIHCVYLPHVQYPIYMEFRYPYTRDLTIELKYLPSLLTSETNYSKSSSPPLTSVIWVYTISQNNKPLQGEGPRGTTPYFIFIWLGKCIFKRFQGNPIILASMESESTRCLFSDVIFVCIYFILVTSLGWLCGIPHTIKIFQKPLKRINEPF